MDTDVRSAGCDDLVSVKRMADAHRNELGYLPAAVFQEAIDAGWLLVAVSDSELIGFLRFRLRRDHVAVIYDVCVAAHARRQGVGRALIDAVYRQAREHGCCTIELKCPVDLEANDFYRAVGFTHVETLPGKRRALNRWMLDLTKGESCSSSPP